MIRVSRSIGMKKRCFSHLNSINISSLRCKKITRDGLRSGPFALCLLPVISLRNSWAIRPSKLFEGVDQRLCIHIASTYHARVIIYTTTYYHWYVEERPALFTLLEYHVSNIYPKLNRIPQVGSREAASVLTKLRVA